MRFRNKIMLTALLSTSILSADMIRFYSNQPAKASEVNQNFTNLNDRVKNIENGNTSSVKYPVVTANNNIIGYYLSDNKVLSKEGFVLNFSLTSGIIKYDTTNSPGGEVFFSTLNCSVNDTIYIKSYNQKSGSTFEIDNNVYYINKNTQIQNSANIAIYYKDDMDNDICREWHPQSSQFDIYQVSINNEAITGFNNTIKDITNFTIDIGIVE